MRWLFSLYFRRICPDPPHVIYDPERKYLKHRSLKYESQIAYKYLNLPSFSKTCDPQADARIVMNAYFSLFRKSDHWYSGYVLCEVAIIMNYRLFITCRISLRRPVGWEIHLLTHSGSPYLVWRIHRCVLQHLLERLVGGRLWQNLGYRLSNKDVWKTSEMQLMK
jgi:hypothetical protein